MRCAPNVLVTVLAAVLLLAAATAGAQTGAPAEPAIGTHAAATTSAPPEPASGPPVASLTAPAPAASVSAAARAVEVAIGWASWYGYKFHGRLTANGETYDMNAHTAAHRTLPFNTVLRVINLDTATSTEVRVNDRGPFVDGRIIDLSMAAAQDLGMLRTGLARVELQLLRAGDPPPVLLVQVGAFGEPANAARLQQQLTQAGLAAELELGDGVTRVVVNGLDAAGVPAVQARLAELGITAGLVRTVR